MNKRTISILLSILILSSCRNLSSVPAYPAEVAESSCIWHEGGKVYLIDKTGPHEIQ